MRKVHWIVVIGIILGPIVSQISCLSSGDETKPANDWAIDIIKCIPYDTSILMITDQFTVRNDPDLAVNDDESFSNYISFSGLAVDLADLDYTAIADEFALLVRNNSTNTVKEQLDRDALNCRKISNIEVWDWKYKSELFNEFNGYVAIHDNLIITSFTEDAIYDWINFITTSSPSLWENTEFDDIFNKLPYGFFLNYNTTPPEDPDIEGIEVSMMVSSKKNRELFSSTGIMKFVDEESAQAAFPTVKAMTESDMDTEFSNLIVTDDGEYISFSAAFPITRPSDD
ncbi:MAG: hypothetical protein GY845_15890 [Planctomycetes bacterium]|nr:hypothetical protein [Planctomycetota bacterium]